MLKSADSFKHWGLIVIARHQVMEIQKWDTEKKLETIKEPRGRFLDFEVKSGKLVMYLKKQAATLDLASGTLTEERYDVGKEVTRDKPFKSTPDHPQFRAAGDWCAVITDGNVKVCHPSEMFQKEQEAWNALPSAKRAALLGGPIAANSAKLLWKALKGIAAALVLGFIGFGLYKLFIA